MDAVVNDIIFTHDANLVEQVRGKLLLDIISGKIPPGIVLSGTTLAQHLGISSSPIREALLQLAADGLLEIRRNRGYVVVTPTVEDLRPTLAVRVRLEVMGIEGLIQIGLRKPGPLTPALYRGRNAIERMFGRLKDFRRIATRYDRLAANYLAAVCLAATISYWL